MTSRQPPQKTKARGIGTILLILAGLIVLNAAAAFGLIGWRLDFTKEGLYSFSVGTRAILKTLDEPVRLDFWQSLLRLKLKLRYCP